jgi:hypothetical protein
LIRKRKGKASPKKAGSQENRGEMYLAAIPAIKAIITR